MYVGSDARLEHKTGKQERERRKVRLGESESESENRLHNLDCTVTQNP